MSETLTEGQNLLLGTIAAFIEAVILQPTLYWKNAKAQQLPFTLNVRTLYRGTGAAILGECQQMGLQFLFTGAAKKYLSGHGGQDAQSGHLSAKSDFIAAGVGGLLSSFFTTPVEMIMIQQQKFGGSFVGTAGSIIRQHGVMQKGIMRGLIGAASRDAIYVSGMLAVTPLVREWLIEKHETPAALAGFYASLLGGVAAAVPSHPFDVIKTCMQGDIQRQTYTTFTGTARTLWKAGGIRRMFSGCMWRTIN
eukprot:gene30178-34062_t